jgi:hypothetical protein
MAISEAMRRLLGLRVLEEEQRKLALESALGEMHGLEHALNAMRTRRHSGRELLQAATQSADVTDRIAGLIECESAERNAVLIEIRLAEARRRAAELRDGYLSKRVERRQAEAVIREAEALETLEAARRDQQTMDDRFTARRHAGKHLRHNGEKYEMKKHKENGPVPEEELRPKL